MSAMGVKIDQFDVPVSFRLEFLMINFVMKLILIGLQIRIILINK